MVAIDEVVRQDGHVLEVRASVDGANFVFRRHPISKEIIAVVKSRQYVPRHDYRKMKSQVRGIFADKRG